MLFWRRPKILFIIFISGMVVLPILFVHPAFQLQEATNYDDITGEVSLDTRQTMEQVRQWLENGGIHLIRDSWGITYGPMSEDASDQLAIKSTIQVTKKRRWARDKVVTEKIHDYDAKVQRLKSAALALRKDNLSLAKQRLSRHYNSTYKQASNSQDDLSYMSNPQERILYGLMRYHRAYAQLQSAARNNGEDELLRDALYNLRRTVAATERLGYRGPRIAGGEYWGNGIPAWVGNDFNSEHGDIAMHHIYTNLATAYLRLLPVQDGYPFFSVQYLEREQKKYAYAEDQELGPHIQRLLSKCKSQGLKLPRPFLRLSQALHNLEAASRGISNREDTAIFHYMTGLILFHLTDYPQSQLNLQVPLQFFQKAIQASPTGSEVQRLAQKETVLILILLQRYDQAFSLLEALSTQDLNPIFQGPQKETLKHFQDFLLLGHIAQGDVSGFLAKSVERRGGLPEQNAAKLNQLYQILANGFFGQLPKAIYRAPVQAGSAIHFLEKENRIKEDPILNAAYANQCRGRLMQNPLVFINFHIQYWKIPGFVWTLIKLGFSLTILAMIVDAFFAHRRIARRLLTHGYN